ncbi:amidohydrolase family protein [uncultured Flavobacterium sp.]|uniref:amidohydrolase family protein n=1 Tax=uncultured Flavobacterium sp. TaxID=165435 RepID=UPI002598F42C|nr:amidohydrolase family protein [uncultured Flavobacterium sp.]
MRYLSLLLVFLLSFSVNAQEYFPKNDGVKQSFKNYFALTNATIYVSATQKIEKATLLIKENKIVDVGTIIAIPKEATIIDATGKTIYPSFIELYSEFGINKPTARPNGNFTPQYDTNREGYYWNDHIKPEYNAYENLSYDEKAAENLREVGFGSILSHHNDGVIAGTGLFWTLNDKATNADRIIKEKVSQHFTFSRSKFTKQSYPSSMMGSMALIRQVFHDAKWYAQGNTANKDLSLEAFNANKSLLQIFNAGDKLNALRADKLGDEFGIKYVIKGSGNEFERIDEIKKTGATYIIPLNFPDAYDVSDPYLAQQVSLSDMKFWNQAPFNLKILAENNVSFIITSADLKDTKSFLSNLRKAVLYGLPKDKALQSLTENPAKLVNQFDKVGSISKGKLANFIIVSGDLFDEKNTILENWVQGNRNIIDKINPTDIKGTYDLSFENQKFELKIEGENSKFEAKISRDSINYGTKIQFNDPWINLVIKNQDTTKANFVRLSGTFMKGQIQGKAVLENGNETTWTAIKKEIANTEEKKETKKDEPKVPSMYAVTYPNIAFGTKEKPKQETILFKNTTVWTGEKEGILKETDVLIQNGKIAKIGKNLPASGAKVVDGTRKHLTAGIIDEHSHIAISNGVNEGGQNSSAEVTIEDVVNSDDINIYRNLAGGVTSANLLHGSANPIGGRAAFIKLKWGYSPDEMLVKDAPKYIKFALGENVKQSNWGDNARNRFPQSRMGVEQVYEDYFTRAIEYKNEWDAYKSGKNKKMPRFDIEMEVLGEILAKKRFITCHSYVQSEINMLMKLAERYGFKIQTFTHILEGYKVADKMSAHGVAGSTFADWWAYKFEVNDAIPYNAAIMQSQGVSVSINSDDAEMSRRLNQEAAKTVKYGNVTEEQAWNFVTLNPAKILQIDNKVGSIKVGKDADVVLWSESPLSIYTKAEKTIIDGIIFYDLEKENQTLSQIQKERADLINAMLDAKNKGMKTQATKKKETGHYHCDTLGEYCKESHYKYN